MSNFTNPFTNTTNILRPTYIDGFMDVSSVFITHQDSSMVGNVYVNGMLTTNSSIVEAGIINQLSTTPINSKNVICGTNTNLDTYMPSRLYLAGNASLNAKLFLTFDASCNSQIHDF